MINHILEIRASLAGILRCSWTSKIPHLETSRLGLFNRFAVRNLAEAPEVPFQRKTQFYDSLKGEVSLKISI